MKNYDDIINLPHHTPVPPRTPMSMETRAAQFAPFAALGHDNSADKKPRHEKKRR